MVGLIRGRLGGFMNDHKLTEYLSSIGRPEMERAKKNENEIAEEFKQLGPSTTEESPQVKEVKPPPKFTPRFEIKNLFSQFAEQFTKSQYDRGVELHWIGVGTWKTPIDKIPDKHMEAWTISHENLEKGGEKALERCKQEAAIQEMTNLIQDVPVSAYHEVEEKEVEHRIAMQTLLLAYRQQLIIARDFLLAKNEPVSEEITRAISALYRIYPAHNL
jgi:hypothetical protein